MDTLLVWTYVYRPFVMGGNVNVPVGCRLSIGTPEPLGKGFEGYVLRTPKGNTIIVDKASGAIIGDSLETVKRDVAAGDVEVMQKQVKDAIAKAAEAEEVSAESFWKIYKR